jgi:peptidylprolyl isomerase
MALETGMTVRVHYRGTLDDGTQFDSSEGRNPLEFTIGAGQVISGFEEAVVALSPGDSVTVTLPADEAYGAHMPEAIQTVPVTAFADEPPLGATVEMLTPDGHNLSAIVTEVGEEDVVLDFNHPLAGQTLTFKIDLVEVVAPD